MPHSSIVKHFLQLFFSFFGFFLEFRESYSRPLQGESSKTRAKARGYKPVATNPRLSIESELHDVFLHLSQALL
jgi:hypothetical protein